MRFAKLFDIDGHDILFILDREEKEFVGIAIHDGLKAEVGFAGYDTVEMAEAMFATVDEKTAATILRIAQQNDESMEDGP